MTHIFYTEPLRLKSSVVTYQKCDLFHIL